MRGLRTRTSESESEVSRWSESEVSRCGDARRDGEQEQNKTPISPLPHRLLPRRTIIRQKPSSGLLYVHRLSVSPILSPISYLLFLSFPRRPFVNPPSLDFRTREGTSASGRDQGEAR